MHAMFECMRIICGTYFPDSWLNAAEFSGDILAVGHAGFNILLLLAFDVSSRIPNPVGFLG